MNSSVVKLLFVCSRNEKRSLTAEKLFERYRGFAVRSRGTQPSARVVVVRGDIGWADWIFVMERSHLERLRIKFGDDLDGKQIVNLNIPDDYEFMDAGLIDALLTQVGEYLDLSQGPEGEG